MNSYHYLREVWKVTKDGKENMDKQNSKEYLDRQKEKMGDADDMAVLEKELEQMKLQQKKQKLTKDEMRKALLKQSVRDNYEALERLSRT